MRITDKFFNKIVLLFFISAIIGFAISYSKVYLFHLVYIVLGFTIYIKYGFGFLNKKFPTKLHFFFFFMLIWYALTIIWSIKIEYSLRYLFYIIIGTTLSLFIIYWTDSIEKLQKAIKVIGIVLLFEIVLSLLETFTNFRLPVSPFSMLSDYFGRANSLHYFTLKEMPSILITPTGFRWNPNNLGIMMTLLLPFLLNHKNPYIKYLASFALLIIVIMTGSRISITACCMILLFYLFITNLRYFFVGIAGYIIALFLLVYFSDEVNENKYGKKVYEITSLYDATVNMFLPDSLKLKKRNPRLNIDEPVESGVARRQLMINGWNAFIDSKGLGVGGGASIAVQENQSGYIGTKIKSMHNFWFEVLVEGGLVMFLVFMSWYVIITRKIFKIWRKAVDDAIKYLSLSLFMALSFFIFAAIGASSTIYFLPMWMLFGFSVAFVNIIENEKNKITITG